MGKSSVRALWKAKLEGSLAKEVLGADWERDGRRRKFRGTVLGIDSSLRGTGLAVVEFAGDDRGVLLHSETVRMAKSATMADCLGGIYRAVASCCGQFDVLHVSLEQTIYVQNFQTAQVLGAARGAAIAAASVAEKPVFEYAPLRVKQAVVGVGRASKAQVAKTVMGLLGHGAMLAADEADAAGVALCHAFTYRAKVE